MYYKAPIKKNKRPIYYLIAPIVALLFAAWLIIKPSPVPIQLSTQNILLPIENEVIAPKEKVSEIPQNTNKRITLKTKFGDTLSSLFEKADLSNKTLVTVLSQISHKHLLENIHAKQTFKILLNKSKELLELTFRPSVNKQLIVKRGENNDFTSKLISLKTTHERRYLTATIKDSLYTTGLKHKIPHTLLVQLTQIFARRINFARDVRDNDRLTLIYQTNHTKNGPTRIGQILAARYTSRKTTHTALNYQAFNKDTDYFTPEGRSLKLSFDRFPIKYTHVSSHFDPHRMHPILHISRPHRGIDLAALQGTEIHAVADGKIIQLGVNSGYGNAIKIQHSKKYETVYAHMVRFKTGLSQGTRVKRGDVIGYVGQTGLATAPHCHFEFKITGKQVDPATISLPSAPDMTNKALLTFKKKTQSLLEQLALYESASTASKT